MGRSFGFVMLIVVLGAGAYIYTKQAAPVGSPASSVIDTIGIQNDLMAMANAERRYFVEQFIERSVLGVLHKVATFGIGHSHQNDLMAMANAERRYFVEHTKYASLDELRRNGDTRIPRRPP